jgi:4-diphosphocytidyl-2-C-methyl-D-erythritol kinase
VTYLRALAPAKLNLCLFIGGLRGDGLHRVVTLTESLSLADELELAPAPDRAPDDHVRCPGVKGPNLVEQALSRLRLHGWDAPPIEIEVRKRIPIAAGLGGGSADAAAALRMAVELAPGRPEEIAAVASSLGADVPSQLAPGLVLCTGAGELTEPFEPLGEHALLVVPQQVGLATAEVYAEADRLGLPRSDQELDERYRQLVCLLRPGARLPAELLVNDLEPAALSLCPAIATALEALRAAGADDALVCGSGPTTAGVFWGADGGLRAEEASCALAAAFPSRLTATPVGAEFGMPRFPR